MDEVDVVVLRNKIGDFVIFIYEFECKVNIRIKSFGYVGDGNLYVYILRDELDEELWYIKLSEVM